MSAVEYMGCTWREFVLRFDGYQIKRAHEFEGHRAVWYMILKTNWDHEKSQCPEIEQLWPLITDDEELSKEQTNKDAEFAHLKKIMELAEKNKLYN